MLYHVRGIIRAQFRELKTDSIVALYHWQSQLADEFNCKCESWNLTSGSFISDGETIGFFVMEENDTYKQYLIDRDARAKSLAHTEPSYDSIRKFKKG